MSGYVRALRFFLVVNPVSRAMRTGLAALALATSAALWLPGGAPHAAAPILVLHAFAASSGFAASARRGHYDLLLTGGVGRWRTALVHWLVSALPGTASCGTVLLAGALAPAGAKTPDPAATLASLFVVSSTAWAATVALPRFAGAIGWLVLAVAAHALVSQPGRSRFEPALTFLLFPGLDGGPLTWATAAPGMLTGCMAMTAAFWWVAHVDYPLEASQ